MNFLEKLTNITTEEFRSIISESLDDPFFLDQVCSERDSYIPIMLKHKFLPKAVVECIIKEKDGPLFLLEKFVDYSYIPDSEFIKSALDLSDDKLIGFFKAFPSYPISVSTVMGLLNRGKLETVIYLVSEKKDLQKDDLLILLIKMGVKNEKISSAAIKSKVAVAKIASEIRDKNISKKDLINYCPEFLGNVILSFDPLEDLEVISGIQLRYELLNNIIYKYKAYLADDEKNRSSFVYRYTKRSSNLEWTPELEKIDVDDFENCSISIENPPKNSKFRKSWILRFPDEADDDELIGLSDLDDSKLTMSLFSHRYNKNKSLPIIKEIIIRGKHVIEKFGVERILSIASSSCITDSLLFLVSKNQDEYLCFLAENTPSRHKKIFRSIVPAAMLPEKFNSRKRSFFEEAFSALFSKNIDEFREILCDKYPLKKFVEDSFQDSKKDKCSSRRINKEILLQLNKEEFMELTNGTFIFDFYDFKPIIDGLKFSFSPDEAIYLLSKGVFYADACFYSVKDKIGLVEKLSPSDFSTLLDSIQLSEIEEPNLLECFLKRIKKEKIGIWLSTETIISLSKLLPRDILTHYSKNTYRINDLIEVVCSDGEYLINEDTIIRNYSSLEDSGFAESIIRRDPKIAKIIFDAYLGGNKALSELVGSPQKIRRSNIKRITELRKSLDLDNNSFFERLNNTSLEVLIHEHPDLIKRIKSIPADVSVDLKFSRLSLNEETIEFIKSITDRKIVVNNLIVFSDNTDKIKNIISKTLQINSITFTHRGYYYGSLISLEAVVPELISLMKFHGINEISVTDTSEKSIIFLLRSGVSISGKEQVLDNIINERNDFSEFSALDLNYLEESGFLFSKERVSKIIRESFSSEVVLTWIKNRIGDLNDYYIENTGLSDECTKILSSAGVKTLDSVDFFIEETKNSLTKQGRSFDPIYLPKKMTINQKMNLIRFIEEKIDPRFSELKIASQNLDNFEYITPFDQIKTLSLDEKSVLSLLKINHISSNKKVISSLNELISLKGQKFLLKVIIFSDLINKINPRIDLSHEDFISISKNGELSESNLIEKMDISNLMFLNQAFDSKMLFFLESKEKSHIISFIKSCSEKEQSYIRDIFQMIESIKNGLVGIDGRIESTSSEEELVRLKDAKDRINARLMEVVSLNNAEAIHDRLIPILSFIKSDPLQPLGQDKFKKLENNKKIEEQLGYHLFFPKTREDLIYLGDNNGWCVNYHRHYGDNVISRGNILVGICEKGTSASRENVIALAHYLKQGASEFFLEQLKWSTKKKDGQRNVDATRDFKHEDIKSIIVAFIEKEVRSKNE